jgi:hypothetical protein
VLAERAEVPENPEYGHGRQGNAKSNDGGDSVGGHEAGSGVASVSVPLWLSLLPASAMSAGQAGHGFPEVWGGRFRQRLLLAPS